MHKSTFLFVHSPLVGVSTWWFVAEEIRRRGYQAVVAKISDQVGSTDPFWKQHAEAVRRSVMHLPQDQHVILVAHSGAGQLLPAIRALIPNPVEAYIFVDAGLPRDGASRLDLMKSESLEWAEEFERELLQGGQYPTWTVEDLRPILPNLAFRLRIIAEMQPRSLPFFTEPLPASSTWPDAPCVYIQLTETYSSHAEYARSLGWHVMHIPAEHFHMLIDVYRFVETFITIAQGLNPLSQ